MICVGLKIMSSSCNDETIKTAIKSVLEKVDFPLLLELLGILFTAIIQSSSAVTGIVIVMLSNEAITIQNALFITLGANIGTCVTALIGVIGTNINSKRAAIIHLTFNVLGCALFTPILWIFKIQIIIILQKIISKEGIQIAIFHLFFNFITAIITTPLIKYLVKFSEFVIKEKENNILEKLIDEVDDISQVIRSEQSINFVKTNIEKKANEEKEKEKNLNEEENENINNINENNINIYDNEDSRTNNESNENHV